MTEPYYQDDLVTLYHGDCVGDLVNCGWRDAPYMLTDPPYGIGWDQRQAYSKAKGQMVNAGIAGDDDTYTRDVMITLWRRHKPALIFGHLGATYPDGWKQMLVFQKPEITGVMGARRPWRRDWEPIFVMGDWPDQVPKCSSVIRTSEQSAGGYRGYATTAGHPHAKPQDVLTRLIETFPVGTIADPFAGSGSTLLAARNLGRRAVGVEIDEAHCERAAIRLSQQPLFADLESSWIL